MRQIINSYMNFPPDSFIGELLPQTGWRGPVNLPGQKQVSGRALRMTQELNPSLSLQRELSLKGWHIPSCLALFPSVFAAEGEERHT